SPLFELRWETRKATDSDARLTGEWLILADRGGTAADLVQRMAALGAQCLVVEPSTAVSAVERKAWRGVVQCRALDAALTTGLTLETLNDAQSLVCGTTLD